MTRIPIAIIAGLLLALPTPGMAAEENPNTSTIPVVEQDPVDTLSMEEISTQLENPLTSLWSLTFENAFTIGSGDRIDGTTPANVLFFQPGLPVPLGDDMTFISRPVFPLVTSPVFDSSASDGVSGHTTGLGDIQMLSLIGPDRSSGFVWGLGGTFKFPTASDDSLGAGKWQAGPAVMLFHFKRPWTLGILAEHWWSFAGDGDRLDTNQTDIKYIARYALPDAWSVGFGPTISLNWQADSDNFATVPVGLGVTKTFKIGKMPVKFRLETHYNAIRRDDFDDEWKILFRIAPVIHSPFKR